MLLITGIRAVSPEPSLFTHMKYGSTCRRRVRPNIRHLAPLDGCACGFEEWVYGGRYSAIISWAGSIVNVCPLSVYLHSREMTTQMRKFEILNTRPNLFCQSIMHFNEHPFMIWFRSIIFSTKFLSILCRQRWRHKMCWLSPQKHASCLA